MEEDDLTDPFLTGEDDAIFEEQQDQPEFNLDSESADISTQTNSVQNLPSPLLSSKRISPKTLVPAKKCSKSFSEDYEGKFENFSSFLLAPKDSPPKNSIQSKKKEKGIHENISSPPKISNEPKRIEHFPQNSASISSSQNTEVKHQNRPSIPKIPAAITIPPLKIPPHPIFPLEKMNLLEKSILQSLDTSLSLLSNDFLSALQITFSQALDFTSTISHFTNCLRSEVESLIEGQFQSIKNDKIFQLGSQIQNSFMKLLPNPKFRGTVSSISSSFLAVSPDFLSGERSPQQKISSIKSVPKIQAPASCSDLIREITDSKTLFCEHMQKKVQLLRKYSLQLQELQIQEKQVMKTHGKVSAMYCEMEIKKLELEIERQSLESRIVYLSRKKANASISSPELHFSYDSISKISTQISVLFSKLQCQVSEQKTLANNLHQFSAQTKTKNNELVQLTNEFGNKLNSLYDAYSRMDLRKQIQTIPLSLNEGRCPSYDSFSEKLDEMRKKRREVRQEFDELCGFS